MFVGPALAMLKLYFSSIALKPELYVNYSIFMMIVAIGAPIVGASTVNRINYRITRRNQEYIKVPFNLGIVCSVAAVPYGMLYIFLAITFFGFECPNYATKLLFTIIGAIILSINQAMASTNLYMHRMNMNHLLFFLNLIKGLPVVLYFKFSLTVSLVVAVVIDGVAAILCYALLLFLSNLSTKYFFRAAKKLELLRPPFKLINLYPLLYSGISTLYIQIDNYFSLKFLQPLDYAKFVYMIIATNAAQNANYLYSISLIKSISTTIRNREQLKNLVKQGYLFIPLVTGFLFAVTLMANHMLPTNYFVSSFYSLGYLFVILCFVQFSCIAFDYSNNLVLLSSGYKSLVYVTLGYILIKTILYLVCILFINANVIIAAAILVVANLLVSLIGNKFCIKNAKYLY